MTIRAKAASVDLGGGLWYYRGYYGIELDADNIFITETLVEPSLPASVTASAFEADTDHPVASAESASVTVEAFGPSAGATPGVAGAAVTANTPSVSIRVLAGHAAATTAANAATSLEQVEPEIAAVPNGSVLGVLDPQQDLTWRRDTWAPDGFSYRSYSGGSFTPVVSVR